MTDIAAAIISGDLSDDASVSELVQRHGHFAGDATVDEDLRLQGQAIFSTAILTDVPAAKEIAQPVVAILRKTMEAIGALYLENERRKAAPPLADATSGSHEPKDVEVNGNAPNSSASEPSSTSKAKARFLKELSMSPGFAAAMEARQKRSLATHGTQGPMSAAAGVVKALKRPSRITKPVASKVKSQESSSSNRPRHLGTMSIQAPARPQGPIGASPVPHQSQPLQPGDSQGFPAPHTYPRSGYNYHPTSVYSQQQQYVPPSRVRRSNVVCTDTH